VSPKDHLAAPATNTNRYHHREANSGCRFPTPALPEQSVWASDGTELGAIPIFVLAGGP
jgi:hypothetical protein